MQFMWKIIVFAFTVWAFIVSCLFLFGMTVAVVSAFMGAMGQ